MGDSRFILMKFILPFSRVLTQCKMHNQIFRIHKLSQKSVSQEIISDIRTSEKLLRRNVDNPALNKHLCACFTQNDNLLDYTVDLITCACNRRNCSSELIFSIIKCLGNYIKDNKVDFYPNLVQKNEVLFSILYYKNYHLVRLICSIFKITEQAYAFKDKIENLIEQEKIVEAAYCISAMHLQKEFDVEKVLLPLLLEEQISVAAIYTNDHPNLQIKVARILDSYLNRSIPSSQNVKPRRIFKTLTSLVNTFNIPLVNCPNLYLIRGKGAIKLLINRRMQQSVSEIAYDDMIKSIVGENEELQRFLIKQLLFKKELKAAMRIAENFNITDTDLFNLECKVENETDIDNVKPEELEISSNFENILESEEKPLNHLEFELPTGNINMVSNLKDFVECIDKISKNYSMVGIDSEWKPHFGLSRDRLSLIQLAGHDKVFIFDVLLLSECLHPEHWDLLLDDVFGNPEITKLGCGIMIDVNMILDSIKGSAGKAIKFTHMLDMALLYQKLQDVYPEKFDPDDKNATKGLSQLCEIILGKPLNKEERLCDWEKRPLKESQLEYAALDAHCLLQMYDKLRDDSIKQDINFDHLAKVAIVLTNSQWKPKRRYKGVKTDKSFKVHSLIPIEKFKVVMDANFVNQGRELRQLGADVVILNISDNAETAIEVSKTEGRIVICSEDIWDQVKSVIKEGNCHMFKSAGENPIKVSELLHEFNVQVSARSILTRCIMCNSTDGKKIHLEDLEMLLEFEKTDCINSTLLTNIPHFSPELQPFLKEILNSGVSVKFPRPTHSLEISECAFFCKSCGSVC